MNKKNSGMPPQSISLAFLVTNLYPSYTLKIYTSKRKKAIEEKLFPTLLGL